MTPLPYLKEIDIQEGRDALILNFDCSNVKEVVEQIKNTHRTSWHVPEDGYIKYLTKSESKYKEERIGMKKIRVKQKFYDMAHNNILRKVGTEYLEEAKRADDLADRGFAIILEEIKEPQPKEEAIQVETAVKVETKKETAVPKKEKATKPKRSKADATK